MSKTICYCKEVNKKTIKQAIDDGACTVKDIKKDTKAGTGSKCKDKHPKGRSCGKDIKKILEKRMNL